MANQIFHYNGFTIRVVGSGNLRASLKGFNDINTTTLVPLAMSTTNSREPTRLANFKSQRARLRIETTAINEWFKINNITVWVKPIASSFPM